MVAQRHDTNRSDTEEEDAELGGLPGCGGHHRRPAVGSSVWRGIASATVGRRVGPEGRTVGGGHGGSGRRRVRGGCGGGGR
jgi:hypothetical protein